MERRGWAPAQNEPIQIFNHKQPISGAVFSDDESRILTWSKDGTARIGSFRFGGHSRASPFPQVRIQFASRLNTRQGSASFESFGRRSGSARSDHPQPRKSAVFNRDSADFSVAPPLLRQKSRTQ